MLKFESSKVGKENLATDYADDEGEFLPQRTQRTHRKKLIFVILVFFAVNNILY